MIEKSKTLKKPKQKNEHYYQNLFIRELKKICPECFVFIDQDSSQRTSKSSFDFLVQSPYSRVKFIETKLVKRGKKFDKSDKSFEKLLSEFQRLTLISYKFLTYFILVYDENDNKFYMYANYNNVCSGLDNCIMELIF